MTGGIYKFDPKTGRLKNGGIYNRPPVAIPRGRSTGSPSVADVIGTFRIMFRVFQLIVHLFWLMLLSALVPATLVEQRRGRQDLVGPTCGDCLADERRAIRSQTSSAETGGGIWRIRPPTLSLSTKPQAHCLVFNLTVSGSTCDRPGTTKPLHAIFYERHVVFSARDGQRRVRFIL